MKPTKQIASQKAQAVLYADEWFRNYLKKKKIIDFHYNRWGKMVYYFLMDADLKSFLLSCPKVWRLNLWDNHWMMSIARHQLKSLFVKL